MKSLAFILAICFFVSCTKEDVISTVDNPQTEPISCKFGITEFNLDKRAPVEEFSKGKPPRFNWTPVVGGSNEAPSVIMLDFDGYTVSNTIWNAFTDIVCAPANLTTEGMSIVYNRILNDYSPFNVTVTTDEAVYNNASPSKRMRVIFTESWEWFGQAGGAAFPGTFGMTNNTPCFVFTSLLNYNTKSIAEAGSHEMGHTLGLMHQSAYNGPSLINEYNYGIGSGQAGWAPIMGCAYYRNISTWHNGATNSGYNSSQDELSMITSKLGILPDDVSGTTTGAMLLQSSKNAIIHNSSDVDCFYLDLDESSTVTVTPYNVGAENAGANLDITLKTYNGQGQLVNTINDPSILNAAVTLLPGEHFVSVSVSGNANAPVYGMVGRYTIAVN